jgi:hypothetical protein
LFSCPDASLQFEWLDEQRIAIDCSKQIFVIDGASGKAIGAGGHSGVETSDLRKDLDYLGLYLWHQGVTSELFGVVFQSYLS